jgi:hypothetical protein
VLPLLFSLYLHGVYCTVATTSTLTFAGVAGWRRRHGSTGSRCSAPLGRRDPHLVPNHAPSMEHAVQVAEGARRGVTQFLCTGPGLLGNVSAQLGDANLCMVHGARHTP